MKCERCGCVILIGEACIGGDGSYHHEDPQTCIKDLAIARDWSRNEARRLAAMLRAMAPVVCAARLLGELEKAEDYEAGLRLRLRDATAVVRAAEDVLRQDDEVDPSAKSLLDLSRLRSAVAAFDEGRFA